VDHYASQSHRADQGSSDTDAEVFQGVSQAYAPTVTRDVVRDDDQPGSAGRCLVRQEVLNRRNPTVLIREVPTSVSLPWHRLTAIPLSSQSHRTDQGSSGFFGWHPLGSRFSRPTKLRITSIVTLSANSYPRTSASFELNLRRETMGTIDVATVPSPGMR
jgi:hypothetical protein